MLTDSRVSNLDLFSRSQERNFSTSGNQDLRPPENGPIVSWIIATCRSALAINRSYVCFTVFVAFIPDARTPRSKAYLSGRGQRGQMFLPPGADNHSYDTASARQCKCGCFSLPLYRKQERSLFTAALEQTSNVPTARDVVWKSGHVWRWACGFPRPGIRSAIASLHCVPSLCFDTVPETRPLPAILRPSAHDVDQLYSSVRQGWAAIPGPLSRGLWPLRFPSRASLIASAGCFATFQARHHWLCRSSSIGREQRQGPASDPPFRAPAGNPTLISLVKWRNRESWSRLGNCVSRPWNAISVGINFPKMPNTDYDTA